MTKTTRNLEETEYLFLMYISMLCVAMEEAFSDSYCGEIFHEILELTGGRFIDLAEKYDYKFAEIEKEHGVN